MKTSKKSIIHIVAGTAMTIFILFSVFSASVAWFETIANRKGDLSPMPVKDTKGRFSKMTFHPLVSQHLEYVEDNCTFSFNKTPLGTITYDWTTRTTSSTGTTNIVLNEYTTLDQYQPILLLIELNDEYVAASDGDIGVRAILDDSTTGFLGARKKVDAQSDEEEPYYNLDDSSIYKEISSTRYFWLSSAVRFFARPFSVASFTTTFGNSETYTYRLGDCHESYFFDIESNSETYDIYRSVDIYSSLANDTVKYIGVVVDYYRDAIEFIYSTFLGDSVLDSYMGELNFLCDWSTEVR